MLRVLHVSDTHGKFSKLHLDGIDLVVHSGDLLPSFSWGDAAVEVPRQHEWLRTHSHDVRRWGGKVPWLFVEGNHEFVDPCPQLRRAGMDVTSIRDRSEVFRGVSFYGFPWVPKFGGWNFGVEEDEMERRLQGAIAAEPDVLVAHCPPRGILDLTEGSITFSGRPTPPENIGSRPLAEWLRRTDVRRPTHVLCGHCHHSRGHASAGPVAVSNAATTQHVIEIP